MQSRQKLKIKLTLVTFLGVMESNLTAVDRAETGRDKMEEEMDESLLDESEEELVAKAAATVNPSAGPNSNKPKESYQSEGSVGSLATSFMKNVVVGSNEVFTVPKFNSNLTNSFSKGSKGLDQDKLRGGGTPKGVRDGQGCTVQLVSSKLTVRHRAIVENGG